MKDFICPQWQSLLQYNNLTSLEDFWQLPQNWIETPNYRRGGWSGVTRWILNTPSGETYAIYVKRQLNHTSRNWRHPFKGEPTAQREFRAIQRCEKKAIPVMKALFFASRSAGVHRKTVLVTAELIDYRSLNDWMQHWQATQFPPRSQKQQIIQKVAQTIRQLHRHGLQHGCLQDKHIFMRLESSEIHIALIDLEMLKWFPHRAVMRDIYTLNQYSAGWRYVERLMFIKYYLNDSHPSSARKFWQKLKNRRIKRQRAKAKKKKVIQ